jgi:hypothetical protein
MFRFRASLVAAMLISTAGLSASAQTLPHAAGTVKATSSDSVTLTGASGDIQVAVPATAKVLVVPPGSKDLKSATPGSVTDIATGDRALVTGTAGDSATSLIATRIVLMKATAIADAHAADEAAWAEGSGGIVKSVDLATGSITLSSGMHTVAITTTPRTIVRRYADGSVSFADAKLSTIAAVHPGDQLRVRGAKSADGSSIAADEIVAGSFRNFSGLLTAIDPAANTISLKDLSTKLPVTISIASTTDLHRVPPQIAMAIAARMRGGAGAAAHEGGASAAPAGEGDAAHRAGGAGHDLSSMISRLPTETLGGLKVGEAVMIVATTPANEANHPTAVTVLAGVNAILTAPAGDTMTLSPWNFGGGGGGDSEGGGAGR